MNATQYKMGTSRGPQKQRGHTFPRRPNVSLDEPGWLTTGHLLWILGCSHSTLVNRIKSGKYPAPDSRDGRRLIWRTTTIKALVESGPLGLADAACN